MFFDNATEDVPTNSGQNIGKTYFRKNDTVIVRIMYVIYWIMDFTDENK